MLDQQTALSDGIKAEEFEAYASGVASRIELPLDETLEACRLVLQQGVREGFNSSADPETGASWPPRKVEGDGHPLLVDTGKMMQAATGGGAGGIKEVDGRSLTIGVRGSSVPYASIHQEGSARMPQRRFLSASEKTLDECGDLIADAGLNWF